MSLGWRDSFAYLDAALKQDFVGSQQAYKPPRYEAARSSGYSPWAVSPVGSPSWARPRRWDVG